MTCRELADFILDYVEGTLARHERERFDYHLSLCVNCRHYLAAYQTTVDLGRRVFDDENKSAGEAGVPDDLINAILSARQR